MKTINLKRGLDLKLKGAVQDSTPRVVEVKRVAICPGDFPGFMPKADVKAGDTVSVGTPLMHDKNFPAIKLVSPVNGVVEDVVRGERRKIERVVVAVGADPLEMVPVGGFEDATRDAGKLRELMQHFGLWAAMRQRPYDIVPPGNSIPRDIFVTTFDSAPLAPQLMGGIDMASMNAGIKALSLLTPGKVYVGVKEGGPTVVDGAEVVMFNGSHPAGNAGVQAANIAPVNKGEQIWTLDILTVARIGRLLLTGKLDSIVSVAVTGPEVKTPYIAMTLAGAEVAPLLRGETDGSTRHLRIISGNVLTGVKTTTQGFLHFPYRQITVIGEGDDVAEFMGWASPGMNKMSQSPTFLSRLFHHKPFPPDARLNGGREP